MSLASAWIWKPLFPVWTGRGLLKTSVVCPLRSTIWKRVPKLIEVELISVALSPEPTDSVPVILSAVPFHNELIARWISDEKFGVVLSKPGTPRCAGAVASDAGDMIRPLFALPSPRYSVS